MGVQENSVLFDVYAVLDTYPGQVETTEAGGLWAGCLEIAERILH